MLDNDDPKVHYALTDAFKRHAMLSAQIDQFLHATLILANNFRNLREAASRSDKLSSILDNSSVGDEEKVGLVSMRRALNSMTTSGLFMESPHSEFSDIPGDMKRLSIYTCYCFQWSIFERFVVNRVMQAVDDDMVPKDVAPKLKRKKNNTKDFLKLLDKGAISNSSPFMHLLPKIDSDGNFVKISYSDLDRIRERRNQFIHSVDGDMLAGISEADFKSYNEDMWTLRLFAQNVDQDCSLLAG